MELAHFITDVQKQVTADISFKRDDLIPTLQVVAFIYDIVTYTDIDRKIGITNSARSDSPAPMDSRSGGR